MIITFICRSSKVSKKDGLTPLELYVIIDGKRRFVSLKRRIDHKLFNPKKQIVRGDTQTNEYIDLTDYANKNGMTLCKTFEEHISGAKKNHERPVLQECLNYCVDEKIDVVLLSELSRLGRNVDEVLANIRFAKDNHLNIYFQKEGLSIYGADNKENPYLTITIAVLGTASQLERENLIFRLKSGKKVYVDKNIAATGKSGLGRKVGYRKPAAKKMEEYKEVLKLLRAGYPIRKVAKLTDTSESTVKRLKREFGISSTPTA